MSPGHVTALDVLLLAVLLLAGGGCDAPAKFDPKMMPQDWEGTWGEFAVAYWLGALAKKLYDRLHRAAHPDSCKQE